jgi:hypothetical protein
MASLSQAHLKIRISVAAEMHETKVLEERLIAPEEQIRGVSRR